MSETKNGKYRSYEAKRYANNTEKMKLESAIKYYRKKRREGEAWEPKPFTKLYIWAVEHNLDPNKLITGEQKLSEASA